MSLCLLWVLCSYPITSSAKVVEFIDSGLRLGHSLSYDIALKDVDGDLRPDAVVANLAFQSNTVWLNDGQGNFFDSGQQLGSKSSTSVIVEDVNNDNFPDAVFVNSGSEISVWLNDGHGNFTSTGQGVGNISSIDIALGDVDGNGSLDAFIANSSAYSEIDRGNTVWLNDGQGHFTNSGKLLGSSNSNGVALADFDGDGDLDAFVANAGGNRVWMNDGDGNFSEREPILGLGYSTDVELGDFDGDGDIDAFVVNGPPLQAGNTVWLNDGSGNFSDSGQRLGESDSQDVALWDIDGDGDLDAFVTNSSGQPNTVWWNLGDGRFFDSGMRLGNSDDNAVALGDVDGDNDLDAFVVDSSGGANMLWLNQGKLIFTLKPDWSIDDPALQTFLNNLGVPYLALFDDTRGDVALKRALGMLRSYYIEPSASTDLEALRLQFEALDAIESCIYDHLLYFDYTPGDPKFDQQDNLSRIDVPGAWTQSTTGSSNVVLAFIDDFSGSITHPDLVSNMTIGPDFSGSETDSAIYGHGRHCAGIAAAAHNSEGIAGICPDCRTLALNVASGSGTYARFDAVFRAIEYAVDEKFERIDYETMVINLSLSTPAFFLSPAAEILFRRWIQYAYYSNVPFVTSMGNYNWDFPHFPAAYRETIAIGAANAVGEHWEQEILGSNYGHWIDLLAPGEKIWSTFANNTYSKETGTSMAAPHVTGVIGLLLSLYPDLTAEETRTLLKEMAVPIDGCSADKCGAGLLNAVRTFSCAEPGEHITFRPIRHDFDELTIGENQTQEIEIENPCHDPHVSIACDISSSSLGPGKESFDFSPFFSCQSNELCKVEVTFQPLSGGKHYAEATLLIQPPFHYCCKGAESDNEYPLIVQLSGIASTPTPTPTITPTPVFTSTATPAPTVRLTATPVNPPPPSIPNVKTVTPPLFPTSTPTLTPTLTPVSTPLSTEPPLPTVTPTVAATPAATPTVTPTHEKSAAADVTPSPTPTIRTIYYQNWTPTPEPKSTPTPKPSGSTRNTTHSGITASSTPAVPVPADIPAPGPRVTATPTVTPSYSLPWEYSDDWGWDGWEPQIPTATPVPTVVPTATATPTTFPTPMSTPTAAIPPTPQTEEALMMLSETQESSDDEHEQNETLSDPSDLPEASEESDTQSDEPLKEDEAAYWLGEGDRLMQTRRYAEAKEAYDNACAIYQERDDAQGEGAALKKKGAASIKQGEYTEAIQFYSEALDLLRPFDEHIRMILQLIEHGDNAAEKGLKDDAVEAYESALAMIHDTGLLTEKEPYILDRLAALNDGNEPVAADVGRGDAQAADAEGVEASARDPENAETSTPAQNEEREAELDEAAALQQDVQDSIAAGRDEAARAQLEALLELAEERDDADLQAEALNNLAILDIREGEFLDAQKHLNQAKDLQDADGDRDGLLHTLNTEGTLRYQIGDAKEATDSFQAALELSQELGQAEDETVIRNNLAQAHYKQGQLQAQQGRPEAASDSYEAAQQMLQEAQALAEDQDNAAMLGTILNNRGLVAVAQGRLDEQSDELSETAAYYDEALDLFQDAAILAFAEGGAAGQGATLHNIGQVHAHQGQNGKALAASEQSLSIEREIGNRQDEARTLSRIGILYERFGQPELALEYYKQALDIQEELQEAAGIEELKIPLAEESADIYQRAFAILIGLDRNAEALMMSQRAKARAFQDLLAREQIDILQGVSPKLRKQEQALRQRALVLSRQLSDLQELPPPDLNDLSALNAFEENTVRIAALKEQLAEVEAEYDDVFLRIKSEHPEYAALLRADPLPLPEIQALLPDGITLIDYYVRPEATTAFVITRRSLTRFDLPVKQGELRELTRAIHRKDVLNTAETIFRPYHRLHQELIAPLESAIATELVGIIPYRMLHYVPFAALSRVPNPTTDSAPSPLNASPFFGDRHRLFLLPGVNTWQFVAHKAQKTGPETMLAFGFNSGKADALQELKYAEQEAEFVAELFDGAGYSGSAARETLVAESASQAGLLHVSSHAVLDAEQPFRSHLVLASDETNDGRLRVREIYDLLLENVKLAVLSACNTSGGAVSRGDEIIALNRAFIYAGAPAVIASLWSVSDEATHDLMQTFYTQLAQGQTAAAALQQARIETRKQHRHPRFWAAFTLTGYPNIRQAVVAPTPTPTPQPKATPIVVPAVTPQPTAVPTSPSQAQQAEQSSQLEASSPSSEPSEDWPVWRLLGLLILTCLVARWGWKRMKGKA